LCQRVATPHQFGCEPRSEPHYRPYDRSAVQGGDRVQPVGDAKQAYDREVVSRTYDAQQCAKREKRPRLPGFRGTHLRHGEIQRVTQHQTHHPDGDGSSRQGGHQEPWRKTAGQFLEDENGPADRSVEGHRESSAGASGIDHLAIFFLLDEGARDPGTKGGTHLHSRAFASEGQSGTHCKQPANELDRHHAGSSRRYLTAEDGFDALDTAALGGGRKFYNQEARQPCTCRSESDRQKPTSVRRAVRPDDQSGAQVVGDDEAISEGTANDSDQHSTNDAGGGDSDHARIQDGHEPDFRQPGKCNIGTEVFPVRWVWSIH
jgi:hypothetical protein